jgi:hypothetical protein
MPNFCSSTMKKYQYDERTISIICLQSEIMCKNDDACLLNLI